MDCAAVEVGSTAIETNRDIPGYRTVGYVERETYAAATLEARMEDASLDWAVVWDDVASFDSRPWRNAVDIITAGYPCQPFSVAGKRRGADDPRHLWPHVARIIGEVEPTFVFLENVAHHLRLGFPEVASGLVGMGYRLAAGLFTAAEVGAPHKRERLFIFAIREGKRNAVIFCRTVPGSSEGKEPDEPGQAYGGWSISDKMEFPRFDGRLWAWRFQPFSGGPFGVDR